jgi:hypothetical protein
VNHRVPFNSPLNHTFILLTQYNKGIFKVMYYLNVYIHIIMYLCLKKNNFIITVFTTKCFEITNQLTHIVYSFSNKKLTCCFNYSINIL